MYLNKDELFVEVTKLPEFSALLAKVKEDVRQLNQTIDELSRFELAIRFSAEGVTPEE